MKPFDLEAAKRGEQIVTRDGNPVELVAHVPEAREGERVVVLLGDEIACFHENGVLFEGRQSKSDLFMAPRKRTVWLNFYAWPGCTQACVHDTPQQADGFARHETEKRIGGKAYPVEIDE